VATVTVVTGGVEISCEGTEAEEKLAELKRSFDADDGHDSCLPDHPLLSRLRRDQAGLRLLRMPWLFDVACGAVLQQRVRFEDACKDWRHVADRFGEKITGGVAFPSPGALSAVPTWELEALGIDAKRARALIGLAREVRMNPLRPEMDLAKLRGRLGRVPGVGPWTVETTLGFGAGDPDALPLGDLYLPHIVSYAFTGAPEGTDEQMVALLEPFRGHRFRVVRLLHGAKLTVPRTASSRRRF
jgi:3-methyladenine DNA glycosylase/8-oxoguanine DNA glycosylase